MALPLSDTWTTGIGHNQCTDLLEIIEDTVTLSGIANLFRTWVDNQLTFHLNTLLVSLTSHTGSTGEILVRRVGTTAHQSHFNHHRIVIGRTFRLHVRDRSSRIWRKRTIEMRFYLREVDFHNLIIESRRIGKNLIISTEFSRILLSKRSNLLSASLTEILIRISIEWEDRTGSTQFCTHITDRSLTCRRNTVKTITEVFENGIGTTLYGKNTENFENHILRSSPTRKFTSKMNTDETRHLEFPRLTGKNIYRISTTNTNSHHSESTGIRRVRISTHHHTTREGIVFEYHLMDDTSTRTPKTDMVFLRNRFQEVINLLVGLASLRKVLCNTHIRTNQVITMNRGRYGHFVLTRIHELKKSHLSRCILHCHTIRSEINIFHTSFIRAQLCGVEKVSKKHLLGISKRSFYRSFSLSYTFRIRSIEASQHVNVQYHLIHYLN